MSILCHKFLVYGTDTVLSQLLFVPHSGLMCHRCLNCPRISHTITDTNLERRSSRENIYPFQISPVLSFFVHQLLYDGSLARQSSLQDQSKSGTGFFIQELLTVSSETRKRVLKMQVKLIHQNLVLTARSGKTFAVCSHLSSSSVVSSLTSKNSFCFFYSFLSVCTHGYHDDADLLPGVLPFDV